LRLSLFGLPLCSARRAWPKLSNRLRCRTARDAHRSQQANSSVQAKPPEANTTRCGSARRCSSEVAGVNGQPAPDRRAGSYTANLPTMTWGRPDDLDRFAQGPDRPWIGVATSVASISMRNFIGELLTIWAAGGTAGVATVVRTLGPRPRSAGCHVVVAPD